MHSTSTRTPHRQWSGELPRMWRTFIRLLLDLHQPQLELRLFKQKERRWHLRLATQLSATVVPRFLLSNLFP